MKKCFFLSIAENNQTTVAYTRDEPPISYELISKLEGKAKLPFPLILKKVHSTKKGLVIENDLSQVKYLWLDYQPNCLAWPIFSERMKIVIDQNITGSENIDWIEVEIFTDEESRSYYILRFNKELDVLDLDRTTFVPNTNLVLKGVFAAKKIEKFSIFYLPKPNDLWKITSGIYINQKLKDALEQKQLIGLSFEEISDNRVV